MQQSKKTKLIFAKNISISNWIFSTLILFQLLTTTVHGFGNEFADSASVVFICNCFSTIGFAGAHAL
jgi:hypothetical protein